MTLTLELTGLKKVRERIKELTRGNYADAELNFAEEQAKSDLREIEAELKNIVGDRTKGQESYSEIITLDAIEELISAIHSAIQESEQVG